MARPPVGPPPVAPSAVVPRAPRADHANYLSIVQAFERNDRRADLSAMLGSDELVDRFLAVTLNALATNSDLLVNADPITIIQAVKDSATLGLEPTGLTGEATIIRYGRVARLSVMWRGYLKRIRNSGRVTDIDVQVVYNADEFLHGWKETGGWFTHTPVQSRVDPATGEVLVDRGDYWGAYAYARMPSGFVELEVMDAAQINHIRDTFSPSVLAGKTSPWDTSWDEMARKTVLRRLAKRLPQEAVAQLLQIDEAADSGETGEVGRLDVSRPRRAALAALGRRYAGSLPSGLPADPDEPEDNAPAPLAEPAAKSEPEAAPPQTSVPEADDDFDRLEF